MRHKGMERRNHIVDLASGALGQHMNRIREVGRIRWICFSLLFSHEKRDFGLRRSEDLMSQTSRNGDSSAELCHSLCGNTNLCITHQKAVVGMGCLELNPNHLISLSKDYPFTYYSNCTPPRRASIICFYKLRVPTYSSPLWCWLCKPQKRTELENWACAWRHSAGRRTLKVRASRPSSVLEGWLEEGSPQRTGDHSVPFSKRPWPILPSSLKLHSEAVYKSVWPSCRSIHSTQVFFRVAEVLFQSLPLVSRNPYWVLFGSWVMLLSCTDNLTQRRSSLASFSLSFLLPGCTRCLQS